MIITMEKLVAYVALGKVRLNTTYYDRSTEQIEGLQKFEQFLSSSWVILLDTIIMR